MVNWHNAKNNELAAKKDQHMAKIDRLTAEIDQLRAEYARRLKDKDSDAEL